MPAKSQLATLKKYGAEIVDPPPAALIESFRAIGYTLSSALADIIDNSISAGAVNIWLHFKWKKDESFIVIHDDGHGMAKKELVEALRPGTRNPLDNREDTDLGRFGLGLKTASFSQCRMLTVLSKKKGQQKIHFRAWNLDYVEQYKVWQILEYLSDPEFLKELEKQVQGTTVVWENLDRIIYDQDKNSISETKFFETIREVEQHLGMVFHRFIERSKLKIHINGQLISPWDPFLSNEQATQSFPTEPFADGQIKITGFVLPHASKISPETVIRGGGINGWNAQQGFYIYRKDRLLVAGDWLQLFTKKEHTRLARIMVEIDASLDFSWQLDIRKSRAIPPKMFRNELKRYGNEVIKIATEVFGHRGKQKLRKSGRTEFEFAWITIEENGKEYFTINRNHPLIRSVREQLESKKGELEKLLKLLEVTLPVPAILLNESRYSDLPGQTGVPVSDEEILDLMRSVYKGLISEGYTKSKAIEELFYIDPFSNYPHLVENLKK